MKKEYSLFLHWKQGDILNNHQNNFKMFSDFYEDCRRQTMLVAEVQKEINILQSDTHMILLEMEETLAEKLINQGVNLQLEEFDQDEFYDEEDGA